MLYPSIDSLLDKFGSKYKLVTVAARRAREMKEDETRPVLVEKPVSHKPVGMALEEILHGHLQYERTDK